MVILLALYPLALAAGVALFDRLSPLDLVAFVGVSPAVSSTLGVLVLAAVGIAAVRHRDNPVLMSAWLFFFCGELILLLGWLIDPFVPPGAHWIEEVFELVAFAPLVVFTAYVASPLRLLVVRPSRRRGTILVAVLLALAAAAVALVPTALGLEGARRLPAPERLLHVPQAVLDMLLLAPLAVALIVIGASGGGAPYAFVGLGLALLLPEDLLTGYGLFRSPDAFVRLAHLVFVVSQLYVLNGALLAAARHRAPAADAGAS